MTRTCTFCHRPAIANTRTVVGGRLIPFCNLCLVAHIGSHRHAEARCWRCRTVHGLRLRQGRFECSDTEQCDRYVAMDRRVAALNGQLDILDASER